VLPRLSPVLIKEIAAVGQDEAVYVSQTCFSQIQEITAGSTPHGSYHLRVVISMATGIIMI
jgi:hypothetical protein